MNEIITLTGEPGDEIRGESRDIVTATDIHITYPRAMMLQLHQHLVERQGEDWPACFNDLCMAPVMLAIEGLMVRDRDGVLRAVTDALKTGHGELPRAHRPGEENVKNTFYLIVDCQE